MNSDYHVHCEYSDDSFYPMEQVVIDAIDIGLDEICFTDHVDYGIKEDWPAEELNGIETDPSSVILHNVCYPKYFERINQLQDQYKDKIVIKAGLEFGMQRGTINQFQKLYNQWPLDFILLSCHQIDNQEFWTQDYQKCRSQNEVYHDYYDELLYLVQNYKDYSVLAHMDLIVRYDMKGYYPFEKVRDQVQKILEQVIADGKGIEINTSSSRYGLLDSMPSMDTLKMYKDLGGTIITIGSDSHKPEDLGWEIEEAKALLREIGFEYFHTFEKMQPISHPL